LVAWSAAGGPKTGETRYNKRDAANPFPGAIEITKAGKQEFKVWPK